MTPRYKVHIQCTDKKSGEVGTFLGEDGVAHSPVFPDCQNLFDWCRANGYVQAGAGLDAPYINMNDI